MEGWIGTLIFVVVVVLVLVWILGMAVKIVQEYERGVIFRLGRLIGAKGPGLFLIIPFVDRMVKVDLRTVTLDVPAQEVITRDNVTIRVSAVLYFRVFDPQNAVVVVMDYVRSAHQIAQTTLRSVLGESDLDELLAKREAINLRLQQIIDEQTEPWGVKVSIVELKDIELPQSMQRAMARQAESEREKRAKIIHATGELESSKNLAEAAHTLSAEPITIQLRYLQTLLEIAADKNSTIIFPVPLEMLNLLPHVMSGGGKKDDAPRVTEQPPSPQDNQPAQTTKIAGSAVSSAEGTVPIAGSATEESGPMAGLVTEMQEEGSLPKDEDK